MQVQIEDRWSGFVDEAVQTGRFQSAGALVAEGLRLVQEQEAKVRALRQTVQNALSEGGEFTAADLDADLDAVDEEMKREGY